MTQHTEPEQQQSGKRIGLGILGFIVGTILIVYLLKLLLD